MQCQKLECKMKKVIIRAILVLVGVALLSTTCLLISQFIQASNPLKIDLMDGIAVRYSGWNGEGNAETVHTGISYTGNDEAVLKFIDTIQISVSPNSHLSNGDTVTVRAIYSDNARNLANVEVVQDVMTCTVDGLNGESIIYEYDDNLKETLTIDGYEIPDNFTTDEERQAYVSYMKSLDGKTDVAEPEISEQWYIGKSENPTNFESTTFWTKDYGAYPKDAYYAALDFGYSSSQPFKVESVMSGGHVDGYRTVFLED